MDLKRSPNRDATDLVAHLREIAVDECVYDNHDVAAVSDAAAEIDRLRATNGRLHREHDNLLRFVAALVVELGGEYEVPESTLVAVKGEVQTEELPERGTVRVRGR